jgi:hypothetical protein
MTDGEIVILEAGHKLDALIAKYVFGCSNYIETPPNVHWFSSDISEAWRIVEKLTSIEYVKVRCEVSHYHGYNCRISAPDESQQTIPMKDAAVFAETMPLAICQAALISLNCKKENLNDQN